MTRLSFKGFLASIWGHLFLGALLLPQFLFADPGDGGGPATGGSGILQNPIKATNIQSLLGLIMDIISILILPFAIFFLVRTGFFFATAGGNEEKIKRAKMDFLYVVAGLAIILGAQLIGAILQNTLNALK